MVVPSVAIIVLNWNKRDETAACLRSLATVVYPNASVIVVDNGSSDDSVCSLRDQYPHVALLETGANLGYAGGINVGIRYALDRGADFTCILNNDVVVDSRFLEPLVETAIRQSVATITTPMICDRDQPETIWALGGRTNWADGAPIRLRSGESRVLWGATGPSEVEYALGTAMLVPARAWAEVGFMDERYFLYFEETDWCSRARQAGFRITAVPAACVWHEVHAGSGRSSPEITYYMNRNVLRFLARNLPRDRRLLPIARVVARALYQALGDTRRGRRQHAQARLLAVLHAFEGKTGPLDPSTASAWNCCG